MKKPAVQERASGPTVAPLTVGFKEAARRTGVSKHLVRAALESGDLPSQRETVDGTLARQGEPAFIIRIDDLENWIAGLPSCGVVGCEEPARTATGHCSRAHSLRGQPKSAETREKIAASKRGKRRPPHVGVAVAAANRRRAPRPPTGEERWCLWCGASLGIVRPSWIHRGMGRFCNLSHAKLWQFENEPGRWPQTTPEGKQLLAGHIRKLMREERLFSRDGLKDPRKRRKWKLIWAPKPGRPRTEKRAGYDDVLREIRDDYNELLRLGHSATEDVLADRASERNRAADVARRLDWEKGVSRRVVRTALGRSLGGSHTLLNERRSA
jgi:hypothetical protein